MMIGAYKVVAPCKKMDKKEVKEKNSLHKKLFIFRVYAKKNIICTLYTHLLYYHTL